VVKLEFSVYDIPRTKDNKVNKTVQMSKEMSQKVNILCDLMNTDFTKATNDMWINAIMRARELGIIDRPTMIQKIGDDFIEGSNPYIRKKYF
jgi:hypothetical protein